MRDLMDFCLYILKKLVGVWFGFDLGSYSYGDFLVAVLVVSVFVGSLVISFRRVGSSAGSVASSHIQMQGRNHFRSGSGSGVSKSGS